MSSGGAKEPELPGSSRWGVRGSGEALPAVSLTCLTSCPLPASGNELGGHVTEQAAEPWPGLAWSLEAVTPLAPGLIQPRVELPPSLALQSCGLD